MRVGDTIIARSSPGGRSARAVVRVSGPGAHGAVDGLDVGARVGRVELGLSEGVRLACLVTRWDGPGSATGEDVCELLVPGNPALVERVIERLLAVGGGGVRRAEAGEFTARAFMNGKLDLMQAEGVARMIAARTEAERLAAARLTGGEAGAQVRRWTEELAGLLALTEAGIDFTDQEDVVAIGAGELARRLEGLRGEIGAALEGAGVREHREQRARVVLVGRPNAGKSTLFNALLGRVRAVVSERAGSTRDVLVEELDLSGDGVGAGVIELCDVAGVAGVAASGEGGGAVGVSHEGGQGAAAAAIEGCDAVVLCDPRGEFEALEAELPAGARGRPVLRVRTKADLPGGVAGGVAGGLAGGVETGGGPVEKAGVLEVCALDGYQVPALRRALAEVTAGPGRAEGDVLPRHSGAMAAAREALGCAGARIDVSRRSLAWPEVVAASLREGLDALGTITGRTTTEEILGRVFSAFCVGK